MVLKNVKSSFLKFGKKIKNEISRVFLPILNAPV